ncbi:MAG: bifunctional diaminohydroxyphosphoribosylaminopyrimidine deaminase/5-amino-6-(5-phosphoribosylamino)uracil reductase RibD [Deltaproteobacteria bacterium]|nr:bifunctional diaminohydroxyphosphoribosylaminopyrimidine deaminase/5-amino-6-(5-phosphoribosylamino)uracil reductase RibD [Deltaproteobacteria bacterium]
MAQALALARKAEGRTAPNPPVGAVVVRKGRIVGRGFHQAAGRPHAEVEALDQAGHRAAGASLYVTLEPCNHQGRTPPCTEKILSSRIKKVVIGALDPNPGVTGNGAARLKEAGLEVETGLLAERCTELIEPFAKHAVFGRPWVCLKMAASLDGRLATAPGQSQWLTGQPARAWVHRLRNRSEAILVGRSTVAIDDPALTTRLARGQGQNPLRVVLDSRLTTDPQARVVSGPKQGGPAGGGCLILTTEAGPPERQEALTAAGAEVKVLPGGPGGVDLEAVLDELGRRGVMRLVVEGGPELAAGFLRAGLVDEVFFLFAPLIIGGQGAPGLVAGPLIKNLSQATRLGGFKTRRLGQDLLVGAKVVSSQKMGR